MPEVSKGKDGALEYWYITKDGERYSATIQFGKNPEIPEFRIDFYQTQESDPYPVTSPATRLKPFVPSWEVTKKIAEASENTNKIKDKTKFLHWKLSPTKKWIYVTDAKQQEIVVNEIVPSAVSAFNTFCGRT